MSFIEELKWRGLLQDMTPAIEEALQQNQAITGYIGFDPTAASLHIGSLAPIMMLVHLQRGGHTPIALIGGATAMIGDPSGKTEERKVLSEEEIRFNQKRIKKQLSRFLNFDSENKAAVVNNYDWHKNINTLTFLREVGKFLTVNYMLSKGFIKTRLEEGEISFTEFNYLLMQAYDFYWLYTEKNCVLQMGGSDQWGNITAGIELIRKKSRKEAYAITCPLITKSDGTKFGKTEKGNIWLDPELTSPYQFYQFWLNASDEDAKKFIRVFTLLTEEEIKQIEVLHDKAPHERALQKKLAEQVTIMVHSKEDYNGAIKASEILFGKATKENLLGLSEKNFMEIFEGVPQVYIPKSVVDEPRDLIEFLSDITKIFPSKGEARRILQGGGISINKERAEIGKTITNSDAINEKYILMQIGKKNYHLVIIK